MTLTTSAAPLNSARRDISMPGTRAVLSSQQLIGASRIWLQDAEDTGHFGLRSNAKSRLYLMQNQHKQGTWICAACKRSSLSLPFLVRQLALVERDKCINT